MQQLKPDFTENASNVYRTKDFIVKNFRSVSTLPERTTHSAAIPITQERDFAIYSTNCISSVVNDSTVNAFRVQYTHGNTCSKVIFKRLNTKRVQRADKTVS